MSEQFGGDQPLREESAAPGRGEEQRGEDARERTDFESRARALIGGGEEKQPAPVPGEAPSTPTSRGETPPQAKKTAAPGKKGGKKSEMDAPPPEKLPKWNFGEEERDYRPVRFRRDGRLGCLGGLMYATFVICLIIVLACAAWMAASDVLALNKEPLVAEVTLPEEYFSEQVVSVENEDGTTTEKTVRMADMDAVTKVLKDYGFINYRWLFKFYASFSHAAEHLDPGTYELSTSYDYRALVKKMQVGSDSQVQTKVTLPEGFTMAQIFARLEENGICSQEELYEAAANTEFSYTFLEDAPLGDAGRLEGFLFPDTYYFYQGMQASSAINKFLTNFHYKLTAEMLQLIYDRGMTYKEAVTVASIIEREAANDDERYLISSVIYNRLRQGMPLQMDATVLYGEGNPEGVAMPTGAMLRNTENLYNTYVYQGLPPGPISNPGMASLRAALNPGDTQYLFYALDEESGTHKFFLFQDEFEAFLHTQSYYEG